MAFRYYKSFRPYGHEIALGHVAGETAIYKYGYIENASATEKVIWDGGETYMGFIDSPSRLSIVSSSIDDNGLTPGSGAHTIKVYGINDDGYYQSQIIQLNGTTPVTTESTWRRVFRMYVPEGNDFAVIGGANHGLITCSAIDITGDPLMAVITAGTGQTLMAVFTIPEGCYGLISKVIANSGKSAEVEVAFKTRKMDENHQGIWLTKAQRSLFQNTVDVEYDVPRFVAGHTDIAMTAIASVSGVPVSASFEILLYSIGNHDESSMYQEIENG